MKRFLGYVLLHSIKEDFIVGLNNSDSMTFIAYGNHPEQAKIFKHFDEIKIFVSDLEDFTFDIAKLFDVESRYEVEYETSVSSKPIN